MTEPAGTSSSVRDRAVIGRECLVGAGVLVTEGKVSADCSLILGAPARVVRTLSDEAVERLYEGAVHYVNAVAMYREHLVSVASHPALSVEAGQASGSSRDAYRFGL